MGVHVFGHGQSAIANRQPDRPGAGVRTLSFGGALEQPMVLDRKTAFVPDLVLAERLGICHSCEHYVPETDRCRLCSFCGKGVAAARAKWAHVSCPAKPSKWAAWKPVISDQSSVIS